MSNYGQITLNATPQLIVAANNNRRALILDNHDTSVDAFIGPDNAISSSNTVKLRASNSIVFDNVFVRTAVYGCTAGSSVVIGWWETSS